MFWACGKGWVVVSSGRARARRVVSMRCMLLMLGDDLVWGAVFL